MRRKGLIPEYDSYHKYITGEDFWGSVEYLGNFFCLKYLSGCFMPYLIKTAPPMNRTKDGRWVPKKRTYYMCFKGNFKKEVIRDKLSGICWDLHYKVEKNGFNPKLWEYVSRKFDLFSQTVRKDTGGVNRTMSLWGAIC